MLSFILNILTFGLFNQYLISDVPMHFQTPGSLTFDRLIDFHDFILIYLIFILVIFLWSLFWAVNITKYLNLLFVPLVYISLIEGFIEYLKVRGFNYFTVEKEFDFYSNLFFASFKGFDHSAFVLSIRRKIHAPLLEIVWTIFPSFILLMIAIPSLYLLYMLDAVEPLSFAVKVIGHQWYWSYEIGSSSPLFKSITSSAASSFDSYMISNELSNYRLLEVDNSLFVPAGLPVTFLITSTDVIHSWAVPSLGIKVDAIPGRLNQVCVTVFDVNEFYGQCSELCGINHGFMPISIVSIVDRLKI